MNDYSLKDCWVIREHAIMPDKRNGGTMMRITLANLSTQVTADTYICPANRNARNWTEVLQNIKGGVIVANITLKQTKVKTFIDADSRPVVVWSGPKEKLEEHLAELWRPKTNFDKIFKSS